jgi:uncharacterized membrane protein YjjP (DUF1212 family)
MEKLRHLLGLLAIVMCAFSLSRMIHGQSMTELWVALMGLLGGTVLFFIYTHIDNNFRYKQ